MSKKWIERSVIYKILFIVICFAIVDFVIGSTLKEQVLREEIHTLWQIDYNGDTYQTWDIEDKRFFEICKGDHIEITGILPESRFEQNVLDFAFYCSVVHVLLDGEEVAEYGEYEAAKGTAVGSGIFQTNLPDYCSGKELKITLDVQKDSAFTKLMPIYMSEARFVARNLLYMNLRSANTIVVLLFLVLIELIAMVYFRKSMKYVLMLFYSAGFSFSIAVWMFCYSGLMGIFSDNYTLGIEIEYMGLYFTPVFVLSFLAEFIKNEKDMKYAIWTKWYARVYLVFDMVVIVLCQMNLLHLTQTLSAFHVLLIAASIFCIYVIYKSRNEITKAYDGIYFYGVLLVLCTVVLEIIRYFSDRYVTAAGSLSESFLPYGILMIAVMMLMGLATTLRKIVITQRENELLRHMAYTDALTKIHNRAFCEERLDYYNEHQKPVTIISMDLNLFKKVNDTYGHHVGDELLCCFAKALESVFGEMGTVGRMGGDEFIVIMDYRSYDMVGKQMERFQECIDRENRLANKPYQISVSYGIADNHDHAQMNAWKVYEEADQNMYAYKRNMEG